MGALLCLVIPSCVKRESSGENSDVNSVPRQVIEDMYFVQSKNGNMEVRVSTPRMERYQNDSTKVEYECFPQGVHLYGYNEEGMLESEIYSDNAKHTRHFEEEKWEVFGNVVIHNFINEQLLETDTLYWDAREHTIYTDCYVKMHSPAGFMQGYGLRSDEMARNAQLLKPFDAYGLVNGVEQVPDTVNFVGPRQPVIRHNPLKIN